MFIGDGFKDIFLAGIGAAAYTGEKGKETVDRLVEKGELTAEQGRELNEELQKKGADAFNGLKAKGADAFDGLKEAAGSAFGDMRENAVEAHMKGMTPEGRIAFIAEVSRIAERQNATASEGDAPELDDEPPAHDGVGEAGSQA